MRRLFRALWRASSSRGWPTGERAHTGAAPPPSRAAYRGWLLASGLLALLIAVGGGLAAWAVHDERGSVWLLHLVPGLQVTGPEGTLIGDFSAAHLTLQVAGRGRLEIDALQWRHLQIGLASGRWRPKLTMAEWRANQVRWLADSALTRAATASAPTRLDAPVEIELAALHIDELRLGSAEATPWRDVRAALHMGAEQGRMHVLDPLDATWGRLRLHGTARVATAAPFLMTAQIEATPVDDSSAATAPTSWHASAKATGPLEAPRLQLNVNAAATATRPAQTLAAQGTLRPFAPWPLGDLNLNAEGLDLGAFNSAWPTTAWSGSAQAQSPATGQPAGLHAQLKNTDAGGFNEGRLPLRQLELEVRTAPSDWSHVAVPTFSAELGSAKTSAGRIEGKGEWSANRWQVDALLTDVQTATLDGRAPPLVFSGPVMLRSAARVPMTSVATAAAASAPSSALPLSVLDIHGALRGHVLASGPEHSLRLDIDAGVGPERVDVRVAELHTDAASASLAGTAVRSSNGEAWHVEGHTTLVNFDPAVWLAGANSSPWWRGPHRLNAKASVDGDWAATVPQRDGMAVLAAWRGTADIDIDKSLLAGVALQGKASWRHDRNGAAQAQVALDLEGNRLSVEGRVDLKTAAAADQWNVSINAPALQRLTPLARMVKPSSTVSGTLTATAHVDGRWPALATQGQLEAAGLHIDAFNLERAQAHWAMTTALHAPLELEATVSQASLRAGPAIESASVRVTGTSDAHRIDFRAALGPLPTAWARALQKPSSAFAVATATATAVGPAPAPASPPTSGAVEATSGNAAKTPTVFLLQAHGGWVVTPALGATGWRGTIEQLEWRDPAHSNTALAEAHNLRLDTQWAGGPAQLTLQPGSARLLGAGLRWSQWAWQAATPQTPMRLDVQADIDPLPVAPWLRAAQPTFGWSGDLTVAGRINIRSQPQASADIVIERQAGDLSVTDEIGTQALGLTDLRFGVAAANGVWNFTQALAGTALGSAAGAVVAKVPAGQTWPSAATPIEGVLEMRVAQLGTWGPWVPAGWRLGGELHASASLSGRLGAPAYTGSVVAHGLSVRNYLQGVSVTEGELRIALRGDSARIENLSARAGDGTLTLQGDASLGAVPRAQLHVTAKKFQVLGRVDRRIVASGEGQLQLDAQHLAFDGQFNIDEGLIDFSRSEAPSLAEDVVVIRRKPRTPVNAALTGADALLAVGPAAAKPNAREMALNLAVDMGEHLRIRGRGIDSGLRGKLLITSPANKLAVNGTIDTVDGTYAAYGQKLSIDRGELSFTGAVENPRLDIEATRPNLDIRVGVAVTGTALNPRVRLFSEPDLAELDKLSWLVLGHASEGPGSADTALLQHAAMALFAGEGGNGANPFKAIGLDDVSLGQKTNGEVKETIVSLGKQLSRRWYVGYERGLNATVGSWQLIYRIAQRLTLRAQSGDDNAVDVIWSWRWQ